MLGRPMSRDWGGADSLATNWAIIGVSSPCLAAQGRLLRKPVREKHAGERHADDDGRRRVDLRRGALAESTPDQQWQRLLASGQEKRDHHFVERQRKGQDSTRQD